MNKRKSLLGIGMILALMALTGYLLLKDLSPGKLAGALAQVRPGWLVLGLGLMLAFVGCEAMCSRLILGRLGHKTCYRRCLGYSFVGFYVSAITPSSTGGQPAQVYYMSKDNIPAARYAGVNYVDRVSCKDIIAYAGGEARTFPTGTPREELNFQLSTFYFLLFTFNFQLITPPAAASSKSVRPRRLSPA